MQWLSEHAAVLQLAVGCITALVWVIYLQAFVGGYRRQRAPMILVTAGAGRGINSHCLVTNLGFEPVSILSIIIDVSDGTRTARAIIPDRNEMMVEEGNEDAQATNQGPMASGTMRDIGRFGTLLQRAVAENPDMDGIDPASVEITIVAATASSLTGASRRFLRMEGAHHFRPTRVETTQHRNRRQRRALLAVLQADIAQDAGTPAGREG